ncbi:GerAB/ArcD/ProY family transporter [Bacillus sp. B15-48]|uniref:GerAB/ArcD/ProY family transporter n=1 Tax=Bacillus sp. B15-48 TaxID=1548601 RepID=UPI00193FAD13|nr:GerAB/ArcD/ProY family transporter [Bacillus sp. B15-48]MBM4765139.1 GerAB/ArcD/ProY family transporter [Bacillus sp. B15-48]
MEKAKISVIQLFALIVLFELGSALVVNLGIGAKKDAWLAILLGMLVGIVLFFIYYFLFRQYPNVPFTGYAREIFGKYVGWIIGLFYVIFFVYSASRNVRYFGDLLLSSTMPETPLLALNILFVLTICYVLYLGFEVFARTSEVLIVVLIVFGLIGNVFVFFSGNVDLNHLRPFLEDGWKPILTTVFPLLSVFPFGELIVFAMLLPYLNRPELAKKVSLSAIITSGLVLSWTMGLNISVLGIEDVERSTFPLLSTIGKVNLFEFIQRLDAIVVFTFLITMFFKTSIYFYVALIGIVDLFKLKNHQPMVLPVGVILILVSMLMASNYTEHTEESRNIEPYFLDLPIMVIIPLLMLFVTLIRNRFKQKGN